MVGDILIGFKITGASAEGIDVTLFWQRYTPDSRPGISSGRTSYPEEARRFVDRDDIRGFILDERLI